jgi:hypothetical protein
LPQYAEVLKLQQRPLDAIDVYNRYIQKFPEDVFVQLRLARLFFDLNILEPCQLLLSYIIERWPENLTARELQSQLTCNS